MTEDPIVITGAARTPLGGFQGNLAEVPAPQLGATAIDSAVERSGITPETVDEVLMGCVLPAGQGQAPARQAALGAGLSLGVACTTINKMCGSGMKSVMLAHDLVASGSVRTVVAGGQESMSQAPHCAHLRDGQKMGDLNFVDTMIKDGLWLSLIHI